MTDNCPTCGGESMPFQDVADEAFNATLGLAQRTIQEHCPDGVIPDFLGEALLSGLLQGVVAAAFSMAADNIEAVKSFLQAELDLAIESEEQEENLPDEGTMVQ